MTLQGDAMVVWWIVAVSLGGCLFFSPSETREKPWRELQQTIGDCDYDEERSDGAGDTVSDMIITNDHHQA